MQNTNGSNNYIADASEKPEALLFEILNEVDDFFEQEQQGRGVLGSARKRQRISYTDSMDATNTLLESLKDQLNNSRTRVETVEMRLKAVEARNLELISEAKERETGWLQEKRELEAKIYAGKLGDKSKDIDLATKLRDALRMIKEMRRAQRDWNLKKAEMASTSAKFKEKIEETVNLNTKLQVDLKKLQIENAALMKGKMELRKETKSPQKKMDAENRSMVKIAQLERSERKLNRRVQALTDELPEATMLREQNREIEAKLAIANKNLALLEKESVTNKYIQEQQKQWNDAFTDILKTRKDAKALTQGVEHFIDGYDNSNNYLNGNNQKDVSPTTVLLMLRELQENEAIVLRSKNMAENRSIELEVQLSTLKQRLVARKKIHEETEENTLKMEEQLRRCKMQCSFLQKQNDALKSIVKSYDDENNNHVADERSKLNANINEEGSGDNDIRDKKDQDSTTVVHSNDSDKLDGKIDANNYPANTLKEYQTVLRNVNERLEHTLKEVAACPSPAVQSLLRRKSATLEIELQEKENEIHKLKKEKSKMEEKIIILEQRVGRGEYNANTTKVVHFTMNPAAQVDVTKRDKVKLLENEIVHLKAMIKNNNEEIDNKMNTSKDGNRNFKNSKNCIGNKGSDVDIDRNIMINNLKKKNERLKQVFKDLRTKYKNAVYILTGWKIDMDMRSSSKPIVLRSIFAENESDRLEFQMSSSGGIQLMDTPFAKQMEEKVLFYLTTCKSFPAFLSQLTLQLFEKTTMTGT